MEDAAAPLAAAPLARSHDRKAALRDKVRSMQARALVHTGASRPDSRPGSQPDGWPEWPHPWLRPGYDFGRDGKAAWAAHPPPKK